MPQQLARLITEADTHVYVSGCDIDGIARGKIISDNKFAHIDDGFGFCSVVFAWDMHDAPCIPKPPFMHSGTAFGDVLAVVDPKSMRRIPWNNTPHFLVDFHHPSTRKPLDFCPRSLLKRIVGQLETEGYVAKVGMEFEFFNFKETSESLHLKKGVGLDPLTKGMFGYSMTRTHAQKAYFDAIYANCRNYGIPLECLHTETGPGVYEAAIEYADAVELADRAHIFKSAMKQIGSDHGIVPCFMAKPHQDQPGCSGHMHFSLQDVLGTNVFASSSPSNDPNECISDIMRYFIAGVLQGLPSIMAILAPTINSYKRLVENVWAPLTVSYGFENRTTALRLITPPIASAAATRIEVRVPGADVNAYLCVAAVLACGLEGIRKNLKCPVPISTDGVTSTGTSTDLPRSLRDAVAIMMEPKSIARQVLGDGFVDHYGATRLSEVRNWDLAVTDYEVY